MAWKSIRDGRPSLRDRLYLRPEADTSGTALCEVTSGDEADVGESVNDLPDTWCDPCSLDSVHKCEVI